MSRMNSCTQVHKAFFLIVLFFCCPSLSFGQVQPVDTTLERVSYLNVTSNFDSVYVLIDKEFSSLNKIGENDLIEIPSGEHLITIVPEYASSYSFTKNFLSDSVYIAKLGFGFILDEQNGIYRKIESQDTTLFYDDLKTATSLSRGYFELITTNKEKYKERNTLDISDFKNTWVKVQSNVDSLYIVHNYDFREYKIRRIANGDSLPFKPGNRLIKLSHQYSHEWSTARFIEEGKTTTIKHNFDLKEPSITTITNNLASIPHYNSNLFIITDDDSKIIVDNKEIGKGAVKLNRKTGPVQITVKNQYRGSYTFNPLISNLPSENGIVIDAYTKPVKAFSRIYSVIPGASQLYKQQKKKSAAIGGGFLILGVITLQRHIVYTQELSEYNKIEKAYNQAIDEQTALELGNELEKQYNITKKRDNERLVFFTLSSLLYAFNIYDAFFDTPESGFRKKTDIEFYFHNNSISSKNVTSMTFRYAF